MSESNENVKNLVLLKGKLENALATDNQEEIKTYFEEFKSLYEQITSKKFETSIPAEKLDKIKRVVKGIKTEEPKVETDEERFN